MKPLIGPDEHVRGQSFPTYFDNSMRVCFRQCPLKFYYEYIRGLTYVDRPVYFVWGEAWHEIKRKWFSSSGSVSLPGSDEWKQSAVRALEAGYRVWDEAAPITSKKRPHDTRANLASLFSRYLKLYPRENFTLQPSGAEVGWSWPLSTNGGQPTPYFLSGSIDGYIEQEHYGPGYLEEKSSGVFLTDNFIAQWSLSTQVTGYIWHGTQMLGLAPEEFGVLVSMACKRIHSGQTPQFARVRETRTELELSRFVREWLFDIEQIERCWERWHWPRTCDVINCVGGVGKTACLFLGACRANLNPERLEPSMFAHALKYRDEAWTPWERGATEDPLKFEYHAAPEPDPLALRGLRRELGRWHR